MKDVDCVWSLKLPLCLNAALLNSLNYTFLRICRTRDLETGSLAAVPAFATWESRHFDQESGLALPQSYRTDVAWITEQILRARLDAIVRKSWHIAMP